MTDVIKNGRIVSRSKNLRGMLEYARKHPVRRVETVPLVGGKGTVRVFFLDGAECKAIFESYVVMLQWLQSRTSWRGCELINY